MSSGTIHGVALALAAAGLVSLAGCASGPGRCVGDAAASAGAEQEKVLLNLDRDGTGIQGYDPVAYFTQSRAVKGTPAHRSAHGGGVYYFASGENKALFDANPEAYLPQYGGYCAYAASINAISPIDPAYWEIVDGRLLLQHNQKAWDLWHRDASGNLVKADGNWPGLVERNGTPPRALLNVDGDGVALGGYDPTSYFMDGRPIPGDSALARTFQGVTYYFADLEHKNAFEKEPAKYVPLFGGFCGYAASINRVSPVDPTIWQIQHGRLVLQHTPEAYRLYNLDPEGSYARAEQNWPRLSRGRCGG